MRVKVDLLAQFNAMLVKIAEKAVQVLPRYSEDCEELFVCVERVKAEMGESASGTAVGELRKKLEAFKLEMENMQSFNRKLIAGLA